MLLHSILEVLKTSLLITGLVITMMLLIEYINVQSAGKLFAKLSKSKWKQVVLGACLGIIPGCFGGFATVSLYSHGLITFGALVAAMIASSGDEAFVMLAMIPKQAALLFALLFIIGICVGLLTDFLTKGKKCNVPCGNKFEIHQEFQHDHKDGERFNSVFNKDSRNEIFHPSKERVIILLGLLLFSIALFSGQLAHHHEADCNHHSVGIFDEHWANILFATLSTITLILIATTKDHFIKEHLWKHIIKKHLLSIFLWTAGALAIIHIGMQYIDIEPWLKTNMFYVILLAALVGMIPESGPNLIFITLFTSGLAPFSVLLTSSISQDGHTSLPLLASKKSSFVYAKLLNAIFAAIIGTIALLLGF